MTDVHFLTASLSLFESEAKSERVRQSKGENERGRNVMREGGRKKTVVFLWTWQVSHDTDSSQSPRV